MGRLAERYLEAVDGAWNEYNQTLKLEQWAAVKGIGPDVVERLRRYLEARGIL